MQDYNEKALVGNWVAYQAKASTLPSEKGKKADTIFATISFAPDGHGLAQYGKSAKKHAFSYHLISQNLIEITSPKAKAERYLITITSDNLKFNPCPGFDTPQQSIDILCPLLFSKQ